MVNINRNNYEEYFIDYLDGKLSRSDKQQVFLFLEQNPDLKEELKMFQYEALVPDEVAFDRKQVLKRKSILPSDHHFDELCIASIEGDLTKKQQVDFNYYLEQNTEKQQEFAVYTKTKLKTNEAIVFSEKDKLKKNASKLFTRKVISIISAAASVVILVGLYFLLPDKAEYSNDQCISHQIKAEDDAEKTENVRQSATYANDESKNTIKSLKTINNRFLSKVKVEEYTIVDVSRSQDNKGNPEDKSIMVPQKLQSIEIQYDYKNEKGIPYLVDVALPEIEITDKPVQKEYYYTLKTFLASTFNKRILNKEEQDQIDFFDIAQAGVNGINRLTGSNMKLERTYDQYGNPDKTEFNSRLIAFSAPISKNSE